MTSPVPGNGQPLVPHGPVGQVRSSGLGMLLFFVTFGVYGWYWYFKAHEELKNHTGEGLGGPLGLVLAVLFGVVSPFLVSDEVGKLWTRRGQSAPVSGLTGLWSFPGIFILIGPFVWWFKTNGALNDYWRSLGAS